MDDLNAARDAQSPTRMLTSALAHSAPASLARSGVRRLSGRRDVL